MNVYYICGRCSVIAHHILVSYSLGASALTRRGRRHSLIFQADLFWQQRPKQPRRILYQSTSPDMELKVQPAGDRLGWQQPQQFLVWKRQAQQANGGSADDKNGCYEDEWVVQLFAPSQLVPELLGQIQHELLGNLTSFSAEDSDACIQIGKRLLDERRRLRKQQHAHKVDAAASIDYHSLLQGRIVYEDDHIVVVDKPAGILSVPGLNKHTSSLLSAVFDRHQSAKQTETTPSTMSTTQPMTMMEHMIVHRLDMDTSGLVVFGRSREVTQHLQEQFREHTEQHGRSQTYSKRKKMKRQQTTSIVRKEYEALLVGHFPFCGSVTIDLPLQRDHEHPPFMRVSTEASELAAAQTLASWQQKQQEGDKPIRSWTYRQPKPSRTLLTVVEHAVSKDGLPYTRVKLCPQTGRTHQLRVHCAAIGFPIIGDPTYGLYGEAAERGGLLTVPSIRVATRTLSQNQEETIKPTTLVEPCQLHTQKAWIDAHTPNVEPMCLHAGLLQLTHPKTGLVMMWSRQANFFPM